MKYSFWIVLTAAICLSLYLVQARANASSISTVQRFARLEQQLERLKALNQQIQSKHIEIKEELETLRIWIRRRA